jgi:hypothetical protein
MNIFHQPLRSWFFDSFYKIVKEFYNALKSYQIGSSDSYGIIR